MTPTDADIRRTFGQRINTARRNAGLTQRELADALTVAGATTSAQAVSEWERGNTTPGVRRQMLLGQVLDTPTAELFDTADIEAVA